MNRLQYVDKIFGNENYLRELESEGNVLCFAIIEIILTY